ncbi:MAG: class A beta-lactamase-related serine hydrolase [Synergistaceae bacterium]|jgi:beta-lactamase class A|nr:class A beta-lactamase-related serine hydrolase [Synergistaceae bacterium]
MGGLVAVERGVESEVERSRYGDWRNKLTAAVKRRHFDVGVYVEHVSSGESFEHNSKLSFPSASIIKLFIFHHLFTCGKEEKYRQEYLQRTVTHDRARAVPGGILHKVSDGASLRLEDLALLMLSVSDNTATNILIDELGMSNINEAIQKLGASDTFLRRKMMDFEAKNAGRDNFTTPSDVAKVLGEILKNRRMVEMLSVQKSTSTFPARLPFDDTDDVEAVLAHKTGGLPGITHDAGIFFYSADPVIAVALTSGAPTCQEGSDFCADIGEILYFAFAPKSEK